MAVHETRQKGVVYISSNDFIMLTILVLVLLFLLLNLGPLIAV